MSAPSSSAFPYFHEPAAVAASNALSASGWLDFAQAKALPDVDLHRLMADWFQDHLMKPHPELGRSGHVCPYMAKATGLDLVRIGVSELRPKDGDKIAALFKSAGLVLDAMTCTKQRSVFRTVVVAFPACDTPRDIAGLYEIQHSLRYPHILKKRMLGLFEPTSMQAGVSNRDFLSFRAPFPMAALRSLVELDAPFVLQNPPMIPIYLHAFGTSGARRLYEAAKERLASRRAKRLAAMRG